MKRTNELNCKAVAKYIGLGVKVEFEFDAVAVGSEEALLELAVEEIEGLVQDELNAMEVEEDEEATEFDSDDVSVKIINYGDIHSKYRDDDVWDYAEEFGNFEYYIDVFNAGIECDLSLDDIKDSYSGEFKDDEAFAREQAESCGAIDEDAKWPQTCIDWEQAAKELMWDYEESGGYYFRNS